MWNAIISVTSMDDWLTFTNPQLPVTLRYPDPTPQGHPVHIQEMQTEASYRAHLRSEGSDEVYFEVGRYTKLTADQAIEEFIKDVAGRIELLEVNEVEEVEFAELPARRFSIRWGGRERVILFVEAEDVLYRIIHDPTSPINRKMLESSKFIPGG